MPTYQFEAMDATGSEIKDVIDAPTEEEAQATIRQMGYFVTKIAVKKGAAKAGSVSGRKKRGRSEEHTSELQSRRDLVCRLLLEKKKKKLNEKTITTKVTC